MVADVQMGSYRTSFYRNHKFVRSVLVFKYVGKCLSFYFPEWYEDCMCRFHVLQLKLL
jgi:hypothetical protein